jgi:site-specific recombinase XerD
MEFTNIGDFTEYLGLQRGLAPSTVEAYRYDLKQYAEWLSDANMKLSQVSSKDLDKYVRQLAVRGLAPKTCKRRIAAISTYHKWLVREDVLKNDPVYFIQFPKAPFRLPRYLNKDERARLETFIEEEAGRRPIVGARNRAILYLMMYAGLRISEVLKIKMSDITLQDGNPKMLSVIGKGNKERQVPLADQASRAVRVWMSTRKALQDDNDLARMFTRKNLAELASEYLFPGRDGQPMCKRTVQQKVEDISKKLGGKPFSCHKLRHTFATMLFEAGVDINKTQALLGHASITTTTIYTHVESNQLIEAVKLI